MAAFLIQLLQTCKPDSVSPLVNEEGYHLSGCCITATILLPTLPGFNSKISELKVNGPLTLRKSANPDIRGITAHKVYPF